MRVPTAVVALLVLRAGVLDAQIPLVSFGAGGSTCGEWVTAQAKVGKSETDVINGVMFISWAQGYVIGAAQTITIVASGKTMPTLPQAQSKYNTISGWVYDPPDVSALTLWITNYCRANPLDRIDNAAMALVAELLTRSGK